MRRHLARTVVLVLVVTASSVATRPAAADTIKTVKFAGKLTLTDCAGLGDPVVNGLPTVSPTVKSGPKNEPLVNHAPLGNHCSFTFGTTMCIKTSLGKKNGIDTCLFFGRGSLWGYCGMFTGVGVFTLVNASGTKTTYNTQLKLTGTGPFLTMSGGDAETNAYGTSVVVVTRGNCRNKTATEFDVAGSLAIKDCTGGTVVGVCNPL